jgi:Right handed beta helix region
LEPATVRTRRSAAVKPVQQIRSIRILLRPGIYWLKSPIKIEAVRGVTVFLGTMELPVNLHKSVHHLNEIMEQPLPLPLQETETNSRKRSSTFLSRLNCKRQVPFEETEYEETDFSENWRESGSHIPMMEPKHATIILRSRRSNEPVIQVRQGVLYMRNIEIQHNSLGLDIWNGNAAVQIQPPLGEDALPMIVEPRPTAFLDGVHISSQTGRGVVNIDGGKLILRNCAVTDCAATGVYIGGPGSHALIEASDVIRNGVGNRIRRGIARGHSGIYLEQGVATIRNSNVSGNTLTGISVVSPDNAFLTLEGSTLMNNGTFQLELPPPGSISRQHSVNNNNTMAVHGSAQLRSGLRLPEPPIMLRAQSATTSQNPFFHLHPQNEVQPVSNV